MTSNHFFRFAICSLFALATCSTSFANTAYATPEMNFSNNPYIVLPAGTNLSLQLNAEVSADDLQVGNALEFKIKGDVRVNNEVVIAHGSRATGMVTKVKKICNGKCSEITFTVEEVQAIDGQMVPLNSTPHIVRVDCCDGTASATIGTLVRANTLDERHIKG